jgi:hypothetical protein
MPLIRVIVPEICLSGAPLIFEMELKLHILLNSAPDDERGVEIA